MAVSGLVTLVLLGGLGVTVYSAASNTFTNDSVSRLKDYADASNGWFSNLVTQAGRPGHPQSRRFEVGTRFAGLYVVGIEPDGTVLFQTGELPAGMPVQAGVEAVANGGSNVREVTIQGVPLRVYTETATLPGGETYFIQTSQDLTEEANLLGLLRAVLLLGGAVVLLASLLAGYLYSGRALVPIRTSIDRRQAALQRQREFAANASHELRTPLTVIAASVEDMLLLARTDSGVVQVERVPLDLSDIATDAAPTLTTLGAERGVRVLLDPLPASVAGDPLRLRQLVTILGDNAIRHSPPGATVTVRVQPEADGALLQVDDQGPGVRPDDLPRLFERFWRADDAPTGGTGLGLAIAKWIVDQHGGTIGAFNRPEGGASFWARLPDVLVQGAPSTRPGPQHAPRMAARAETPTQSTGPDRLLPPQ
jgi:signal transduction histidine kinase